MAEGKNIEPLVYKLNNGEGRERLDALNELSILVASGEISRLPGMEVNNHVHTIYSFSPYSPSGAAFAAWLSGLQVVGLMDHDSVAGAPELIEGCRLLDIASTIGVELRVNFSGTRVEGFRTNNPDSKNISYITLQGIPVGMLSRVGDFLASINKSRTIRSRKEVAALNKLVKGLGIGEIDFEEEVLGKSMALNGGTVTERHILAALGRRLIKTFGKGKAITEILGNDFGIELSPKVEGYLKDNENSHYLFDLLGAMKGDFLLKFFIQPDEEECPSASAVVELADSIGAIPAYSYLGDVDSSPTGDKKAQAYEDSFLELLMEEIKKIGFRAVTYMPPRNKRSQLDRIQQLCRNFDFMEISGVDINSSRQVFNCPEILEEKNHHLIDSTWALVAHEKLADYDRNLSLFSRNNPLSDLPLFRRIELYSRAGKELNRKNLENRAGLAEGLYSYGG